VSLPGGAVAAWSDRSAGDLRPGPADGLAGGPADTSALARFVRSAGAPPGARFVVWLRQVHGARVVAVPPGCDPSGAEGDALVAPAGSAAVLAVLTADCGSVALSGDDGSFAAVHAGWRGLTAGVVDRAVDALVAGGASRVWAALGPCVHPSCYAFSPDDLDAVARVLGPVARGRTAAGDPALDLPAAVAAAAVRSGAVLTGGVDRCTACSGRDFSHRARLDSGRQALVVWASGADR
jgi:copper oxidase (laccase) domain-containing protein